MKKAEWLFLCRYPLKAVFGKFSPTRGKNSTTLFPALIGLSLTQTSIVFCRFQLKALFGKKRAQFLCVDFSASSDILVCFI